MASSPETIQALIDATDARLLVLIPLSGSSYSIDGQSVDTKISELVALKEMLNQQLVAAEGPWEVEDKVIT